MDSQDTPLNNDPKTASNNQKASEVAPLDSEAEKQALDAEQKILWLSTQRASAHEIQSCLVEGLTVQQESSPRKALAHLYRNEFKAVFAEVDFLTDILHIGQLVQSEQILQEMPIGVLVLENDFTIVWSNGRLRDWFDKEEIVGHNFYEVLNNPDILDPGFCPFTLVLSSKRPALATIRVSDNRFFQIQATLITSTPEGAKKIVVTVRNVTEELHQQQKLAAIHQAGIELADLTAEEVESMNIEERVELLKDNILHCTQDVLQYDVVEIRRLDQATKELHPVLAHGIKPEAALRQLFSDFSHNGVTGHVAATGKSYLCDNTLKDPLYLEGAIDARSSLTVPLVYHDKVIGTLNVESPEASSFSQSDLQFTEIFSRDVAVALNTLDLLAAEKASTAASSVEAIHAAVAKPVDDILNDAVNVIENFIGHDAELSKRLRNILSNARDIKQVIQSVGQSMAPSTAVPGGRASETCSLPGVRRILVVDEDSEVRSSAHELLEKNHCVVETAHDGNEACYMVRNLAPGERYDVIISDIRLPDFSGYQLILRLQKMMDRVPMVLMTGFGYDPGHSIVKAREAGFKRVLYKPFRPAQLIQAIDEVIQETVAATKN